MICKNTAELWNSLVVQWFGLGPFTARPQLDPWSWNQDPTSCAAQTKNNNHYAIPLKLTHYCKPTYFKKLKYFGVRIPGLRIPD